MDRKKSLLEKYNIPLNHLDFAYVEKCSDTREMERIVQILRSGEEGFYPDLMKSAEEKLRQLKPDSTLFRIEEPIRSRHSLGSSEWKPIYDWTEAIKTKDNKLSDIKQQDAKEAKGRSFDQDLPPIRINGKINENSSKDQAEGKKSGAVSSTKYTEIVASTDYGKWDKYDPDEEILKMDLADERVAEEVERKNRLNLQNSWAPLRITELGDNGEELPDNKPDLLQKLTDVEREQLAEDYKLHGNEYFKAKEYKLAIAEYNKAIKANAATAAPVYNNRAIANIKLEKYQDAIDDCNKCLELDSRNIKALLRKAEASYRYGRKRQAYEVYQQVLAEFDANNTIALKATKELRAQLGELAPPHATRLKIKEEHQSEPSNSEKPTKPSSSISKAAKAAPKPSSAVSKVDKAAPQPAAKAKDYDLAKLIVPNRMVKNKLSVAAAALGQAMANSKPTKETATAMFDPQAMIGAPPRLSLSPSPNTDHGLPRKNFIEEI